MGLAYHLTDMGSSNDAGEPRAIGTKSKAQARLTQSPAPKTDATEIVQPEQELEDLDLLCVRSRGAMELCRHSPEPPAGVQDGTRFPIAEFKS